MDIYVDSLDLVFGDQGPPGPPGPTGGEVMPTATYTSLNGTIAQGGIAQVLVEPNAGLQFLRLANPSTATESLFFRDDGHVPAGDPDLDEELSPGAVMTWDVLPEAGVQIVAATAGHPYRATKGS